MLIASNRYVPLLVENFDSFANIFLPCYLKLRNTASKGMINNIRLQLTQITSRPSIDYYTCPGGNEIGTGYPVQQYGHTVIRGGETQQLSTGKGRPPRSLIPQKLACYPMFLTQLSVVVIGNSRIAFFCLIKSNHITDMGTLCISVPLILTYSGLVDRLRTCSTSNNTSLKNSCLLSSNA